VQSAAIRTPGCFFLQDFVQGRMGQSADGGSLDSKETMAKTWVLDTETKGTGAAVAPL
jgi:hypothetical protein